MIERFFITLVRHGETVENRESVIQGQADTSLSDLGRRQASLAGKRLQYERFTHAFSSDLSRAADTAQAIVDSNKVSNCQLVKDRRLRERSFGIMQGQKFSELQEMLKERKLSYKSYTPEGGESIEQVTSRASSFFKEICLMVGESQVTMSNQSGQSSQNTSEDNQQHMDTSQSNNDGNGNQSGVTESNGNFVSTNTNPSYQTSQGPSNSLNIDTHNSSSPSISAASSTPSSRPHSSDQLENVHHGDISILIVSHGLWLREFKKVLLNRYKGNVPDDIKFLMNRVSPNTGVSKFAMCVSSVGGETKKSVKCVECCFLDCKSHLRSIDSDDLGGSKY